MSWKCQDFFCACERNGEELDSRFLLEYNIKDDLGMKWTVAESEEIPSRKCKYVHQLKNKENMCRTCPVSLSIVSF